MKIVKFKDGSFGIRKYIFPFGYEFREINGNISNQWWSTDYVNFSNYCKSDDFDKVMKMFSNLTDKGEPII